MLTKNNLNIKKLKLMSNAIRALSMDAVEKAKSGHPGMPLGMADVVTILFKYFSHSFFFNNFRLSKYFVACISNLS